MIIEHILRHIEGGGADFRSEVDKIAEAKSLPCSGGCTGLSDFGSVVSPAAVIVSATTVEHQRHCDSNCK